MTERTRLRGPYTHDSYRAVHSRLHRWFGKAREYPCWSPGCDKQAAEWAWQRVGPSKKGVRLGTDVPITWGTDIADYKPMCVSHHRLLDHS